ncbi:type II secretion system minor pseudopilin GspK [Glaciecola sp. XM2]|uniref:type II secretion system minor pseudopilin GspK n=1 Tax=Glaciecola sp. XM2 TaxID=1914931 RepID=UPI001BDDDEA8|nr:type II secretion system minor pseudopilin GspK [Glaciecola sp. XM2]MBT1451398.1 type II secretion system minor pseudopilin GspK [Glaciecola sp. XM2]
MKGVRQTNQRGIALVVVLLIVALISILATQMAGRLQLNVVRAQNIKENNQAYWYALGAEEFARSSLSTLSTLSPDNTNLSQPWAQVFEYPVLGGSIKAELYDMQSCFNLNAINSTFDPSQQGEPEGEEQEIQGVPTEPPTPPTPTQPENGRSFSQQAFFNLAEMLINDNFTADTITDSLSDWIDPDDRPSNFGAEDIDYESRVSPYLAANSPMSSKTELRLVNGIGEGLQDQWLANLLPLVCVIPETSLKLNVNTVKEEHAHVLAAVLGDTLQSAQAIISNRPPEGYANLDEFKRLPAVTALNLQPEQLDWFAVNTKYFKLSTTAQYNNAQFKLNTLFSVDGGTVTVIRREFGGF